VSTKPPNQSVKLTKTVVEKCPLPATGQAFLRDSLLPGFALRVTARGTRAFIVEKRINARVRRITLGRFGVLTVEEARRHAKITLGKIAFGTPTLSPKNGRRGSRPSRSAKSTGSSSRLASLTSNPARSTTTTC
jgi:Arm DNA-binding domain